MRNNVENTTKDQESRQDGAYLYHTSCPLDGCGSSDAAAVYLKEDGTKDGWCWSCDRYIPSDKVIDDGKDYSDWVIQERVYITKDQHEALLERTTYDSKGYRGISPNVCKGAGVLTEFDNNGKVRARYYPCRVEGELSGYKVRLHPKRFVSPIGYCRKDCDLFGMSDYQSGQKRVLLVGGEEDRLAAHHMLRSYQASKNMTNAPAWAVVCPMTGEGSVRQIKHKPNWDWLNSFDQIILGYDNDEAGKAAVEKLTKILPKDKLYIAEWPEKDPNKCLNEGKQKEFISAYFSAAKHTPAGIVGSGNLLQHIRARAGVEKISLPPFAATMQDMMAGGIPLGYIVNAAAPSGAGKSSLVNEFIYHWIRNSPHRVGVVSLESDLGEYGELLLSRHIGKKIALMRDEDEKQKYLDSVEVEVAAEELFKDEYGVDRFDLLDDQGGMDIDDFKQKCQYMTRGLGCKVIVIDPLTLLLSGRGNEEIDEFMSWQKKFIKSENCTFFNICHVRKNSSGQKANSTGASIHEEDIKGSGSILQVGGCNILFMRDKEAEDPVERNTTKVVMSKCRWTGITGPAGEIYYDNNTHTLMAATEEVLAKARGQSYSKVDNKEASFMSSSPPPAPEPSMQEYEAMAAQSLDIDSMLGDDPF